MSFLCSVTFSSRIASLLPEPQDEVSRVIIKEFMKRGTVTTDDQTLI